MKNSWMNGHIPLRFIPETHAVQTNGQQPTVKTEHFTESVTQSRSEPLLQASRRLDWRFLLPDPNLKRVAYFGPTRGSLVTSLELFAHKLTVFTAAEVGTYHQGQYDVVVASDPSHGVLKQAVSLVRPDGALYVEAHGVFWPERWLRGAGLISLIKRPRLWHPNTYVRVLQQLGLSDVHSFWFWPNFEGCTQIVPLQDSVVSHHVAALAHTESSAKARAKNMITQWLLRGGWPAFVLPCFGIVAQRDAASVYQELYRAG